MNKNLRYILKSFTLSLLSFLLVIGVLYAATTIGSNISTDGTLLINNATSTITNLVMVNATSTNATSTALGITGLAQFTGGIFANSATSTINNLSMVNATSTNATTTALGVTGLAKFTGGIFGNNATSSINNLDMVNSTSTNATSTVLYVSTTINFGAKASTTALAVGTSTPWDISVARSTGTTTLSLFSPNASGAGTCIEMTRPGGGGQYRIYVNAAGTGLTVEAGACK